MDRLVRNRTWCGGTHRRSRQGTSRFILTEILVAMAVIAVVLGLLLPGLRMAQEKTAEVQLQSWLRDVARATSTCVQDHQRSFAKVNGLAEIDQQVRKALEPYLKDNKFFSGLGPIRWWWNVSPKSSLAFVKRDQIPNPRRVSVGVGEFSSGKALVIFADGHVEVMEDIYRALQSSRVAAGTTGGITPEEGYTAATSPFWPSISPDATLSGKGSGIRERYREPVP